ncbi:MAG: nuclear transport factor 2 family protein [Deltaproteobacteria bacterium]|nr:MAG: nuclear transport factor 2 family protein [Deltaproteobacteria bacterium]
MLTKEEAHGFAASWLAAWNAHDLDQIMAHYDDDVDLVSPVVVQLLNAPEGRVTGKTHLRTYFQKGLEAYPELQFVLKEVLWGLNSVVLYYANQRGTHTGEYMELSPERKVVRVVANYSG